MGESMIKKLFYIGCTFLFTVYALGGCDRTPAKDKMVNQAMYQTLLKVEDTYQLHVIARSVRLNGSLYKAIGMQFQSYRPLTKDEGRKALLYGAQQLLDHLNANPDLRPFFEIAPLTMNNIEFVIFAAMPDGGQLYDPDISVFALRSGVITYTMHHPDKKFHEVTREVESYSDALKMIEAQSSGSSDKSE
jgi:hypothetical protein